MKKQRLKVIICFDTLLRFFNKVEEKIIHDIIREVNLAIWGTRLPHDITCKIQVVGPRAMMLTMSYAGRVQYSFMFATDGLVRFSVYFKKSKISGFVDENWRNKFRDILYGIK